MLGRRTAQQGLFGTDHLCRDHVGSESFYGSLSRLGPQLFKDEAFAGLYREEHGRPSVPPSQLCVALLLQTYDGVSDEEAIERTAYDRSVPPSPPRLPIRDARRVHIIAVYF